MSMHGAIGDFSRHHLIIIVLMGRQSILAFFNYTAVLFSEHTPLHYAARHGHVETCRLLLQCYANLEAKDDW
jgi:hypothetical protein